MIKFSDETYFDEYYEYKIGKKRLKNLEKTLRLLGNFDNENIVITDDNIETTLESYTYLYEIEDNNHTSFKFYNYGSDDDIESIERYNKNFYLIMQRKDDNFIYKYDFDPNECTHDKIRVIEIAYQLTDTKIIKLTRTDYFNNQIIIEEKDKCYRICLNGLSTHDSKEYKKRQEEKDNNLLRIFESIIEKAKTIDTLNLENVLKIISDFNLVSSCYIEKDNETVASIYFKNGKIYEYNIVDPNKKIQVRIGNEIKRTVEREGYEPYTETIKENYDKIINEETKLFRQR